MFWWILGFITIALAIFLIYKRINSIAANKSKEPQLETSAQNDKELLTQIDTEATTIILPNLDKESDTSGEPKRREASNTRQTTTTTHIEWTKELIAIRRIMLLAPKKRKTSLGNDTSVETKQYERYETLSIEEQYELTKQFAKLIEEADNLRNQGKLTEERSFCINAIKWCAKNGLSIIYWQCRLNEVNSLLGLRKISIGINVANTHTVNQYLTASDKNALIKRMKAQFEAEYTHFVAIGNHKEAQKVMKKAIEWAEETQQMYYRRDWIEQRLDIFKTFQKNKTKGSNKKNKRKNTKHRSSEKSNNNLLS